MITKTLRQKMSKAMMNTYLLYLKHIRHVDVGHHCLISWRSTIDRANPRGVHIGDYTRVNLEALIIAHDFSRGTNHEMWTNTTIGHHCVIGGRAIILPGVTLGNHVFVAAGSVVTKSFPDNCLIGGNPAKIIRTGIEMNDRTQIINYGTLVKK